jgi:hypothetical protein
MFNIPPYPRPIRRWTPAVIVCTILVAGSHGPAETTGWVSGSKIHPGLPVDFQRGVNHAHIHRRGHGYGSAVSAAQLDTLRSIGVTWIALMPFGYQNGVTGDRVFGYPGNEGESEFFSRSDPTMTDDDVLTEIAHAHERGLQVLLKPHIWSSDFWHGNEWHGTIDQNTPEEHRRWWNSYCQFAMHYASIAQQGSADMYCVGTELVKMSVQYPEDWIALIARIRTVYNGPLTYAAHWDEEFSHIVFWDRLDYIGVNAYFPLEAPLDATVDDLVRAWEPHRRALARISGRYHRPVLFLEAGYRPAEGTYRKPWRYNGMPYSPHSQAVAFDALFRALHNAAWWKGVYFWKTWTDPDLKYERDAGSGFSFLGLPAEAILRAWYGGPRTSPPPTGNRNGDE